MEFLQEKIECNLRRANTELSVDFRRANTEPSVDFRKANTEPSVNFRRANSETYWKYNVNLSKRVGKDRVFLGLAGMLLGISLGLCPREIPWSSPASPRKTPSFPPLLLRLTHSGDSRNCPACHDTFKTGNFESVLNHLDRKLSDCWEICIHSNNCPDYQKKLSRMAKTFLSLYKFVRALCCRLAYWEQLYGLPKTVGEALLPHCQPFSASAMIQFRNMSWFTQGEIVLLIFPLLSSNGVGSISKILEEDSVSELIPWLQGCQLHGVC